jgi:hypothetical protein
VIAGQAFHEDDRHQIGPAPNSKSMTLLSWGGVRADIKRHDLNGHPACLLSLQDLIQLGSHDLWSANTPPQHMTRPTCRTSRYLRYYVFFSIHKKKQPRREQ